MRTQIAPPHVFPQSFPLLLILASQLPAAAPIAERCTLTSPESVPIIELAECRPAPVSGPEKTAILASLPQGGEITTLRSGERAKIDAVERFLRSQDRIGVYTIKVIDAPQAWVGLYARSVLLITRSALNLLSAPEMTAIVAHEMGHEYVDAQFAAAQLDGNAPVLRRLELICDALAVAMLTNSGESWEPLVSAVDALARYNLHRFGEATNTGAYPGPRERQQTIRRIARELAQNSSSGSNLSFKRLRRETTQGSK